MPREIGFETKPEIALRQVRQAQEEGVPPGVVLGDAGYGVDTAFRASIAGLGLAYVLGVQSSASLWPPGEAPLPAPPYAGRGRPPTRVRRAPGHEPISAKKCVIRRKSATGSDASRPVIPTETSHPFRGKPAVPDPG